MCEELSNIVYIFTDSKNAGIMFYDRTLEIGSAEAKFVGTLPEGKFLTDRASISAAKWDETINVANGTNIIRYKEGNVKVKTIIVSEKKLQEILDGILKSKDPSRIIIDTGKSINNIHETNLNEINSDDFKSALDNNIEKYNEINYQDSPIDNNINSSNIKL